MTRRDFELIAAVVRETELTAGNADYGDCEVARGQVARAFAERLASTNPRFDRERFLSACEQAA